MIDLSNARVSQVSKIKQRDNSFVIKWKGKVAKRTLSAETREEAEAWVEKIRLCVGDQEFTENSPDKIIVRSDDGTKVELKREDTDKRYPNNATLYRKLKEKLNKVPKANKKRRKTEHMKRPNQLLSSIPNEKEVRLNNKSAAKFGDITNPFRAQLESLEKYLMNDKWFKLFKFEKGSRITYYQKEMPFGFVSSNKKPWMILLFLYLIFYLFFGFGLMLKLLTFVVLPLFYFKPILKLNKQSVIYRSSRVVDYSPKIVFEYLKSHYRQEVKFCGGRVLKNLKEISCDNEKQIKAYHFKFEPAYDDLTEIFQKETSAVAQEYW
mmetsp:Transcript_21187/g.18805  ORF Transcript_21187/g.18805 Transcript_21187/m.18805 type:complete len:322 (+) Transcript_21187:164-1129(+)